MIGQIKQKINCLDILRLNNIQYTGLRNISCPFHKDINPSFGIFDEGNQFKCFSCNKTGDCIDLYMFLKGIDKKAAINDLANILNIKKKNFKDRIESEYIYKTKESIPYMKVIRLENKSFPIYQFKNGTWVKGKPNKLIPYLLNRWYNSDKNIPIWIVEGEKDADNLSKLGIYATTNSGGAGNFHDDLIPYFKDRKVIICTDRDSKGDLHKYTIVNKLYTVASKIDILDLPNLAEKEDISDWIEKLRCKK